MKIGRHEIGPGRPCILIAEAGVNHNGNVEVALEMVRAAAAAGAHAFKIQAYTTSEFCSPTETYTYLEHEEGLIPAFRRVTERQVDMFRRCELGPRDIGRIVRECRIHNLEFIATATD